MTKPDIWYVAYGRYREIHPDGRRHYARTTKTFPTEIAAKNFAAEILSKGWTASAGTLNPHEPKKIVTPSQIRDWAFSATPKSS
jgi:hypothetical protein